MSDQPSPRPWRIVMLVERLPPGVRFCTLFFWWLLVFSTLFWGFSLHLHLTPLQRTIAQLSVFFQHWVGGGAQFRGTHIVVETLTMDVNYECTGIFVTFLFASFLLAYPAPWLARLGGLAVGAPLLFIVNVLRLATLARIVEIYPGAFFYFHEYVWQGIFMVVVLVGSIAWAERFG